VVACEYGILSVSDIHGITINLLDGLIVQVGGTTGIVCLLE
jgi:tetrahydromethanopterin S-methyltransferase subunit H